MVILSKEEGSNGVLKRTFVLYTCRYSSCRAPSFWCHSLSMNIIYCDLQVQSMVNWYINVSFGSSFISLIGGNVNWCAFHLNKCGIVKPHNGYCCCLFVLLSTVLRTHFRFLSLFFFTVLKSVKGVTPRDILHVWLNVHYTV